ncbi:BREX-3 system P-loop-containing protein BrxF [Thiocapsa sp.]|uniref:BREX-3 system P-loop-containing protein BrxF n=1 Tax=Thiocapsa sp. TaxID=2024551 RepID=UPI002C7F32DB|nr:BREX-3 system P-loop-containing protein BrxF [Thiocapsa sp.]HSO82493.1 BREX-3 system P-loop-containing protein BrxF [Thiocapsa sp.]
MSSPHLHDIERQVKQAPQLYHRLILVVGHHRTGKTTALRDLATKHGWPIVNLNLALAERLLDLTARQRTLRVARMLDDILAEQVGDVVLLDNIEMLFHPDLQQDPLRLLQSLSRNRTLVATWRGDYDGRSLIYASPDHPEYRRFDDPQARIISMPASDTPSGITSTATDNTA